MTQLRALVAVCHHRPFRFGHVGFGYQYTDGRWRIGATEGEGWHGVFNGFWTRTVADLDEALSAFAGMRAQGNEYDAVKLLDVRATVTANPGFADEVLAWVQTLPYKVIDRNCMDSSFDVLNAYAPGYAQGLLPKPEDHWLPNDWYAHLPGNDERRLPTTERLRMTLEVDVGTDAGRDDAARALPAIGVAPSWRTPGSPDFLPPRQGRSPTDA